MPGAPRTVHLGACGFSHCLCLPLERHEHCGSKLHLPLFMLKRHELCVGIARLLTPGINPCTTYRDVTSSRPILLIVCTCTDPKKLFFKRYQNFMPLCFVERENFMLHVSNIESSVSRLIPLSLSLNLDAMALPIYTSFKFTFTGMKDTRM